MSANSLSSSLSSMVACNNEGARLIQAGNHTMAITNLSTALEKSKVLLRHPDTTDGRLDFDQELSFHCGFNESQGVYQGPISFTRKQEGNECHPIRVEARSFVYSAAIIFNLAQATFLQSEYESCPKRVTKLLTKAAKLYEYGLKIMRQAGDEGQSMYYMCTWNNLAHIYGRLGDMPRSNAMSHQLLRMALYLSEVQAERPDPLLSFFLGNTMCSLFHMDKIQTAAAA